MPDYAYLGGLLRTVADQIYQHRPRTQAGKLGDGTTTKRVAVANSTIHVYFRPNLNTSELWEVRHINPNVPRYHGWPCMVRWNETLKDWEVAETDVDQMPGFYNSFDFAHVMEHGSQHEYREDDPGHDPVWIYRRAIVNLRPRPAPDDTLRLYIQRGALPFSDHPRWLDGYGPYLSGYLPATGERWLTHYIVNEPGGAVCRIAAGATYPADYRWRVNPPDAPAGTVAIAYVALGAGATELSEQVIWDARQLWAEVSMTQILLRRMAARFAYLEKLIEKHIAGEL